MVRWRCVPCGKVRVSPCSGVCRIDFSDPDSVVESDEDRERRRRLESVMAAADADRFS